MELSENKRRMALGQMYTAFTPELIAERSRCTRACNKFNDTRETTRRHRVVLWRDIVQDKRPLPPQLEDPQADEDQFAEQDPWVEPPLHADYGYNIQIAPGSFVNFNSTFVDTCVIKMGSRVLCGPNCSFYAGSHPLDPAVRDGLNGPEDGKEIHIEDDVWIGGNVTILAGVTIGRGSTVGAASVVTKSVPPFHVVAGSPARIIRKIETPMDPDFTGPRPEGQK